jgi:hypothetical protein
MDGEEYNPQLQLWLAEKPDCHTSLWDGSPRVIHGPWRPRVVLGPTITSGHIFVSFVPFVSFVVLSSNTERPTRSGRDRQEAARLPTRGHDARTATSAEKPDRSASLWDGSPRVIHGPWRPRVELGPTFTSGHIFVPFVSFVVLFLHTERPTRFGRDRHVPRYVCDAEPSARQVKLTWTDRGPQPG